MQWAPVCGEGEGKQEAASAHALSLPLVLDRKKAGRRRSRKGKRKTPAGWRQNKRLITEKSDSLDSNLLIVSPGKLPSSDFTDVNFNFSIYYYYFLKEVRNDSFLTKLFED